ncbi:MAG: Rne/Rng family ribonuclease [Clostridia bacterium]|nr:Rne/Rng family ribonuclease [Clostridia bacterium]
MTRKLIVDDSLGCIRAAVLEDGTLCEIHSEKQAADDQAESLYLGRIQSIQPSLHAAFVDIGTDIHAFLPMREGMDLRCGEMIIVQGQARQSTDSKGLRITDNVNLAGKWLVLLPNGGGVHISKKIKVPALREALEALGKEICPPDCGLIIRTAGEGVTEQLLFDEAQALYRLWLEITARAKGRTAPGLLHQRLPLHLRLARDMGGLSEILINSESGYRQLVSMQESCALSPDTQIQHFQETSSLIFDAYNIESRIDKVLKKRVWLPCGGYLVIDHCEAMTVIDVNSGKMVLGRDLENTALRVNLEAAQEAARQLRLRDIGGIVLIDFIDMREEEHKQLIVRAMREAVLHDRTQVTVEGFTRLGLMEITRKRKHEQLRKSMRASCSYCSGVGEVLSGDEVARRALRQVRRMILGGQRGPFVIRCGAGAAQALCGMPAPDQAEIYCLAAPGHHAEKFDIEQIGSGMPPPNGACALSKGLKD